MLSIFRAITDRLKAMFATSAALELEAEFVARDAERRADLLRQADRYDAEGLHGIAGHLRQQADDLSIQRPLASVLPTLIHLELDRPAVDVPEQITAAASRLPGPETIKSQPSVPKSKKRGGKSS